MRASARAQSLTSGIKARQSDSTSVNERATSEGQIVAGWRAASNFIILVEISDDMGMSETEHWERAPQQDSAFDTIIQGQIAFRVRADSTFCQHSATAGTKSLLLETLA
jgi:hypothetical protein